MPREACVFAQFLRLLPRYESQRIVDKYNSDYRTRKFQCWHQPVCMMFAHIRQENSRLYPNLSKAEDPREAQKGYFDLVGA
jgi:hypothetical protein